MHLNAHVHSYRLYVHNTLEHAVHPHGTPTCTPTMHLLEYVYWNDGKFHWNDSVVIDQLA